MFPSLAKLLGLNTGKSSEAGKAMVSSLLKTVGNQKPEELRKNYIHLASQVVLLMKHNVAQGICFVNSLPSPALRSKIMAEFDHVERFYAEKDEADRKALSYYKAALEHALTEEHFQHKSCKERWTATKFDITVTDDMHQQFWIASMMMYPKATNDLYASMSKWSEPNIWRNLAKILDEPKIEKNYLGSDVHKSPNLQPLETKDHEPLKYDYLKDWTENSKICTKQLMKH